VVNSVLYLYAFPLVPYADYVEFQEAKKLKTAMKKYRFIRSRYVWSTDYLKGVLNWNWRSLRVALFMEYKKDCDGYAFLMRQLLPIGKTYTIIPYHPKNWKKSHVVYVYADTVFSSGNWLNTPLKAYVKARFEGMDCAVWRTF